MKDNAIKVLRTQLGMTQVQLSKALKVTQVCISAWEHGKWHPEAKMLSKLKKLAQSKGIDVTYEQLLGE